MNLVILHGRLGADPELRFTQSGLAILRMSVATDDDVKRGDKWEKETTWHRVVMFGKRAEGVSKHLSKGDAVLVNGRIKNGSYEDKEGIKRYTSDVIVDQFEFGSKRGSGAPNRSNDEPDESRSRSSGGGGTSQRSSDGIGGRKTDDGPPDDFNPDDDIPFDFPHGELSSAPWGTRRGKNASSAESLDCLRAFTSIPKWPTVTLINASSARS